MEYRTLPGSTLHVSAICLGTMTFGQQNSEAEGHAQLDYAFARGVNFIDTAEMYPVPPRADTVHATERIVGSWLARQDRDKVVLATKATGASRGLQCHWRALCTTTRSQPIRRGCCTRWRAAAAPGRS